MKEEEMSSRNGLTPGVDDALAQIIAKYLLQGIHLGIGDKCKGLISKCWNIEDEVFGERKIWHFKCLCCGKSVDVNISDVRDFEDMALEYLAPFDDEEAERWE